MFFFKKEEKYFYKPKFSYLNKLLKLLHIDSQKYLRF